MSRKLVVPESRQFLNEMKYQIARELGLSNYQSTDKGNLTSRQNGFVGGNMTKKLLEISENHLSQIFRKTSEVKISDTSKVNISDTGSNTKPNIPGNNTASGKPSGPYPKPSGNPPYKPSGTPPFPSGSHTPGSIHPIHPDNIPR